jgi:hypothetical protein
MIYSVARNHHAHKHGLASDMQAWLTQQGHMLLLLLLLHVLLNP